MIEAIVVCVDYDDYLAETLPYVREAVDRLLVVSASRDSDTPRVCENLNVECLTTDAFFDDGAVFWKGRAINAGLRCLSRSDWILHLDADIAMMHPLNCDGLDPHCLYTAPRLPVLGREEWRAIQRGAFITTREPKKMYYKRGNLLPCGYFQLWNVRQNPFWYDERSKDASKSDWAFNENFPPERRRILDDIAVYHLEMPGDNIKANWQGRRTPRFC